ncbi:MAG: uracil-DNA glycosylase family protein [Alphaproteobacteria bacterium]|nr:uracil-DNA glycosylase family protein [Alphaproteobacteria bacterium]OJV12126.1 MAG: hypothetical protein BGO27_05240 [Alphaproteobacteria bacterium 33-17]
MDDLEILLRNIRNCNFCTDLPLGPRPIIRTTKSAKILIIGQAPGTKAHDSNTPWNDASGNRLRDWLGLSKEAFYDEKQIAIIPMGFCYPGKDKNGGDKPPKKECSKLWHESLLNLMPNLELTLLVGSYSQKYYLKDKIKENMTKTVYAWQEYLPKFIPLPHPSWRNTAWLKKNPWFERDLLPFLRQQVHKILDI